VFSALGFYPVCPATDQYILGTPLFKKAEVSMSDGKTLLINAPDNGRENFYVSGMKVNGRKYTRTYLEHDLLRKGAVIDFTMSDEPSKNRSVSQQDRPYSFSNQR
jgi:putative alpha-1,2-mannosidase